MMERGSILWADLEPTVGHEQGGRRPVLLASGPQFNATSGTVISFPLTTAPQHLGFPFTALLPPGIVAKPSWVKLSQVRTISVHRLGGRLGHAPDTFVDLCLTGFLQHCQPRSGSVGSFGQA